MISGENLYDLTDLQLETHDDFPKLFVTFCINVATRETVRYVQALFSCGCNSVELFLKHLLQHSAQCGKV
jgi:IS4 transposase